MSQKCGNKGKLISSIFFYRVLEKEPTETKDERSKDENEDSDTDEESEDDDNLVKMKFEERQKDTWDCESILSTYSNLYNHPKIIEDPPKEKKPTERTGVCKC